VFILGTFGRLSGDQSEPFAAESHVDRSIYEPASAIETNMHGNVHAATGGAQSCPSSVVHISTDEVYGDMPAGEFADEDSPVRQSSPYSASKAGSDLLVLSFVRTYGFPAVITRSSNNYGPYQFPEKFLPLMITNALDEKPLPIYGDGTQQRDWLHVEDNCRGILAVLEGGRVGTVYNIGGLDVVDNLTIARRLLQLMGKLERLLSCVQDRPGHDRRYALRCQAIEDDLGWRPTISLQEGLQQTVEWYKTNQVWLTGVRGGAYRFYYEKYYENRDSSLRTMVPSGSPTSRRLDNPEPSS
jgi:dTDP-glucose 4,6-dehydratase